MCYGFGEGHDSVAPRDERRAFLRESFYFDCQCAKCSLSGAALAESERRIAAIGREEAHLSQLLALGALPALVELMDVGLVVAARAGAVGAAPHAVR